MSPIARKPTWFPNRSDTQTELNKHRGWLGAGNFRIRKKRNCIICVVKTKALISFAVTAKLICGFVFAIMQIVGLPMWRLECVS